MEGDVSRGHDGMNFEPSYPFRRVEAIQELTFRYCGESTSTE
jgi:hypothetical protein